MWFEDLGLEFDEEEGMVEIRVMVVNRRRWCMLCWESKMVFLCFWF